nr:hypothetical protein [uncultured Brevundimonas sp.]
MLALPASALLLGACDPIDTSAFREVEETVAGARRTVELANQQGAQIRHAVQDPGGALRSLAGARLARTPTDQPGVFVLTDLATGCQFLATYADDGRTVSSIAQRTQAGANGGVVQRCVTEVSAEEG